MAKKSSKKTAKPVRPQLGEGVEILNAGSVLEDPITRTLETNYMPYAMSVIVSRALPEIDGFKPAHRKLLYTMYEMGLIKGARTKSANIVGSTMHLNPHGDAAIYDTMVRMGRGNESLLVPFVDSKGNFGKAYSRDMSCAAARYTEAKLEGVCEELFRDIDKETVDFVPNYDGTTTEPTLLPVTFPTILANNTLGIAVGMACNICSFNLAELCSTTIALMKDAKHDISTTMPAPDFVGGGQILYDEAQHHSIAALAPDLLTVTFNGLSKTYRVAGFRQGWMVLNGPKKHAKGYIEGLEMLASMRLCANVPAQHAIQTALGGYQSISEFIIPGGRLYEQRNRAWELINDIPGVSCMKPKGALYMFPKIDAKRFNIHDDQKMVLDFLLQEKVLLVQGTAFNWPWPDHVRIVTLPREDDLEMAISRFGRFLSGYHQL